MRYSDFQQFLYIKGGLKSIGRLSQNDEDLSLIQQAINLNDSAKILSCSIHDYIGHIESLKNDLQKSKIEYNNYVSFINSQIKFNISECEDEYNLNYEEVKSKHEKGEVLSENEKKMLNSIERLVSELEAKTLKYKASRQNIENNIRDTQECLDDASLKYNANQEKLNQIKSIKKNFNDEERAILQEYETQFQKILESKVSLYKNRPKIMNNDKSILEMALKEGIIPIVDLDLHSNSTGTTFIIEGSEREKYLDAKELKDSSDNKIDVKRLLKEGVWHKAIIKGTGHSEPIILQMQKDGRILAVSPMVESYLLKSNKLIDVIKPSGEYGLQADRRNCATISLHCLVNLNLENGFIINGEKNKSINDVIEASKSKGTWTTEELLKVTQNSKYFKSCGIDPNTFTVTNSEGKEVTLKDYRDKWKTLSPENGHNMRLDFLSYYDTHAPRRNSVELIDAVLEKASKESRTNIYFGSKEEVKSIDDVKPGKSNER